MPTWRDVNDLVATDRYVWNLRTSDSITTTIENATIHSDVFSYPTTLEHSVTFSEGFEEQIRRIVRKVIKECLSEEGFIVGKLPDEGPDEQSFNDIYTSEKDEDE